MKRTLFALVAMTMIACNSSKDSAPVSNQSAYPVSMSMGGYTTASVMDLLIPKAYATVSDLKFCFKRLRFKKDLTDTLDPEVAEDNIDLNLGQVNIAAAGTSLGVVNIPAGTYYRVEFDLEPTCAGSSVILSNDWGTFASGDRITIKFDGVFVVDGSESLQLGVQDILDAANAYNGVGRLKDAMESASGSL